MTPSSCPTRAQPPDPSAWWKLTRGRPPTLAMAGCHTWPIHTRSPELGGPSTQSSRQCPPVSQHGQQAGGEPLAVLQVRSVLSTPHPTLPLSAQLVTAQAELLDPRV